METVWPTRLKYLLASPLRKNLPALGKALGVLCTALRDSVEAFTAGWRLVSITSSPFSGPELSHIATPKGRKAGKCSQAICAERKENRSSGKKKKKTASFCHISNFHLSEILEGLKKLETNLKAGSELQPAVKMPST